MRAQRILSLAVMLTVCISGARSAAADEAGPEEHTYKLSLSRYWTSEIEANDINLRASRNDQTGWIGFYREMPTQFQQLRGGYERTDTLGPLQLLTSLQAASRGFLGGALTAQVGDPVYVLLGFGRTNLKPYANLNFDPNDAITYGIGWQRANGPSVSLFAVRDDRVMRGQQVTHAVVRMPFPDAQRITLDVFDKSGPADPGLSVKATGVSLTYDWKDVFLRVAHDPKVNFTQQTMTRVALGFRF